MPWNLTKYIAGRVPGNDMTPVWIMSHGHPDGNAGVSTGYVLDRRPGGITVRKQRVRNIPTGNAPLPARIAEVAGDDGKLVYPVLGAYARINDVTTATAALDHRLLPAEIELYRTIYWTAADMPLAKKYGEPHIRVGFRLHRTGVGGVSAVFLIPYRDGISVGDHIANHYTLKASDSGIREIQDFKDSGLRWNLHPAGPPEVSSPAELSYCLRMISASFDIDLSPCLFDVGPYMHDTVRDFLTE